MCEGRYFGKSVGPGVERAGLVEGGDRDEGVVLDDCAAVVFLKGEVSH